MKSGEWVFLSNNPIEINDPSLEACIIYLDKNGKEMSREYFGNNSRIIINKNYKNN